MLKNNLLRQLGDSADDLDAALAALGILTESEIESVYASQSYVDTAVANLVNSSPEALDTLNELAAALGDDENFATTVTNALAAKLNDAAITDAGGIVYAGVSNINESGAVKIVCSAGTFYVPTLVGDLIGA